MTTVVGLAALSVILFLVAVGYAALVIASDADDQWEQLSDERRAQILLYGTPDGGGESKTV